MHVRMTSMTSSVERTDLAFKISVALASAGGICAPPLALVLLFFSLQMHRSALECTK